MTLDFLRRLFGPAIVGLGVILVLFYLINSEKQNLQNPAVLSGWFLFGLLILLGTLNVRKKLIAFNLGAVRFWVAFHIVGGLAAVIIFLVHTNGVIFPLGLYEQIIALLFWIVSITGIFGTIFINVYPRRLSDAGGEVVYDAIPSDLSLIHI